jgi:hypothetical protein
VEPTPPGLLHDLVWDGLLAVVVSGRWTDHVSSEGVALALELEMLLG